MVEVIKGAAAGTTAKDFTQQCELGSKLKLHISLMIEDLSKDDFQEILSFIATSSHNFYLSVGEQLNSKP